MKMNEGVEWAVHCAVLLAALPEGASLPATRLAEYHGIPAPYLAKSLQALMHAGIVESTTGRSAITLLHVVQAIEGPEPMFRCTEIRRRGPSRVAARQYSPMCGIAAAMERAEQAWQDELRLTTVADLARYVMDAAPPAALEKGIAWVSDVLSIRGRSSVSSTSGEPN
jgi:Rrf2 family protein